MTLAGLPATMQYGGTLLTTTAPLATTDALPMRTPGTMTAFRPIKQWSSMTTGLSTMGMIPVSRR